MLRILSRRVPNATRALSTNTPSFPLPEVADGLSRQLRPAKGWWDQQERVNFNEPVHESDDILSMWAPDVHKVAPSSALFQLILAGAGVALFSGGVYLIKASPPGVPREYYDPTTPAKAVSQNVVVVEESEEE